MSLNDVNSLSHTKWNRKYHIVFAPKYRREAVGKILRQLREWKGVKIVRAEVCTDYIHMLVEIPPKMAVVNSARLRAASSNLFAGVRLQKRLQALLVSEPFRHFLKIAGYAGGVLFWRRVVPRRTEGTGDDSGRSIASALGSIRRFPHKGYAPSPRPLDHDGLMLYDGLDDDKGGAGMRSTIRNGHLTIEADTRGGELQSILSSEGLSDLWSGDKRYWGYRAPTLFPIIGRLRDDRAVSAGGEICLPKHGLARRAEFELARQGDDFLCYRYRSTPQTKEQYPYDFCLEIGYELKGWTLTTRYKVTNTGEGVMPFVIGGHPAFAVPLTEGEAFEDYRIAFPQPETAACSLVDESTGLILGSRRNQFLKGKTGFTLNHVLFRGDALIFDTLQSRSVRLYSTVSGHGVKLDFEGMDILAVWSPVEDAPFVCLEPWTGSATLAEEDDVFEHKRGVTHLGPGESKEFAFTITVY